MEKSAIEILTMEKDKAGQFTSKLSKTRTGIKNKSSHCTLLEFYGAISYEFGMSPDEVYRINQNSS